MIEMLIHFLQDIVNNPLFHVIFSNLSLTVNYCIHFKNKLSTKKLSIFIDSLQWVIVLFLTSDGGVHVNVRMWEVGGSQLSWTQYKSHSLGNC